MRLSKILNQSTIYGNIVSPPAHNAQAFDHDLLALIRRVELRIVAVVIDKKKLKGQYPVPNHPYHLPMDLLLQRYCGFLNHVNHCGDVMAESRGGHEDRLLKNSYARVYEQVARVRRLFFSNKHSLAKNSRSSQNQPTLRVCSLLIS